MSVCAHCGVSCVFHNERGSCAPCKDGCTKAAALTEERDRIARTFAMVVNAYPKTEVCINGVPWPGIAKLKLTKEQLEGVHGSENKTTG